MSVEILSTAAQLYEHVGMWELSIVMSVSVCLSVTVRKLYGTICPIFTILCMTVARFSSGGVAIHYVLPVSRMTSFRK